MREDLAKKRMMASKQKNKVKVEIIGMTQPELDKLKSEPIPDTKPVVDKIPGKHKDIAKLYDQIGWGNVKEEDTPK